MREGLTCKMALYSLYPESSRVEQHCSNGGLAAFVEDGYLVLRRGNNLIPVEEVKNIPITFGGAAQFNVYNVLAASLAAYTSRINLNIIAQTLRTFIPSSETTPGRMNLLRFPDFSVITDYAHNPHAVRALGQLVTSFPASVRTGVVAGVGDRRDEDIIEFAEEAAKIFDRIIVRQDKDLRGRPAEDINSLLLRGFHKIDPNKPVHFIADESAAVDYAIQHAISRSLIVFLADKIDEVTNRLHYYLDLHQEKAPY
jgi:cyanophycin synthetase